MPIPLFGGGPKIQPARTFDEATSWLRSHGFALSTTADGTVVSKDGCTATIAATGKDGVKLVGFPSFVVGGEPAKLVNKGYQQFFTTATRSVPATAEVLKALHSFSEEVKVALDMESLYNESLGTVSTSYAYDRIVDRDKPEAERTKRPWDAA